jgi:hypothetical protein
MSVTLDLVPIADIRAEVTVSRHEKLLDETEAATVTNLDSKQIERLPAARRSQLTDIVTPFVSSAVAPVMTISFICAETSCR